MSSPHNQPVVEDIVSAFKTTQNQSWSMFNDKLGNIPVKDCKKKDIFKSENPIELSDKDISVFGVVPRLEELTLISCNKCSMVVKRDCIHYHYDRRHSNPNNDFSLENFIMPNAKTRMRKRQKGNGRKTSEKKIIADEDIEPVIEKIKTKINEEEFKEIQKINQMKIKDENEILFADNEYNVNLITSYNPSTSFGHLDYGIKSWKSSFPDFVNHIINEKMTKGDNKDFNKSSAVSPTSDTKELKRNKLCLTIVREKNGFGCIITPSKLNNLKYTQEQINYFSNVNPNEVLSEDEPIEKSINVHKHNDQLPSVLQEQTKCTSNIYSSPFISNEHSNNSTNCKESSIVPIDFIENTSDTMNNKCSTNITTIDQSSSASLNVNEEIKIIPSENYSNVVCDESEGNDKINDNSQLLCYQLSSGLQSNKEREIFTSSKYKYLNVTGDKSSSGFVANNDYQLTELPEPLEITSNPKYLDVNEDNCERKDYSEIDFSESKFKLLNNETQAQLSPNNKNLGVTNRYSCITITNNDNLSTLPFNIKEGKQFTHNNKTVTNNENSDNTVTDTDNTLTGFDQPLMTVDFEEESKPLKLVEYIDDDGDDCGSKYEHCYQLSTEYSNEVVVPLSSKFNYVLSDDEENVVIDDCKNNSSFLCESRNNEEETNCTSSNSDLISSESYDNSLNNCDKSTTELLDNEGNSKSTVIHYLNSVTDNFENDYYQLPSELSNNEAQPSFSQNPKYPSNISYTDSDNCVINNVHSSNVSSEIKEDTNSLKNACASNRIDENSNKSVTNDDYMTVIDLQGIIKKTKSIQANVIVKRMNRKQFIDFVTKIDESHVALDDKSKYNQTNLSLECLDCYKTNEVFLDDCVPINSNKNEDISNAPNCSCAQIATNKSVSSSISPVISSAQNAKFPVNNFTPVSSNAQINNTVIFTSAEEELMLIGSDECDHYIPNSSNNLSCSQKFPKSVNSQNEHLSNPLTHSSKITENYLPKNNDKVYNSEPYADNSKPNENIFYRNIINGSTPHLDKNQVICKDLLKKNITENISFIENYNSYSNVGIEPKIKKNLKRRAVGQIADDKENHSRWTGTGYKKLKRLEFVMRKRTYSDESDNNDNVDE